MNLPELRLVRNNYNQVYSLKFSPYVTPKPKLMEEHVQLHHIKTEKKKIDVHRQLLENRLKHIENKEHKTIVRIEQEVEKARRRN